MLDIIQNLTPNATLRNVYSYGSQVYGTATLRSDRDFIVISDDLEDHKQIDSHTGDISIHSYKIATFQDMLDQHKIFALESYFLPSSFVLKDEVKFSFKLDKPLLRKEISAKSSNSWVKCKKKLEVEHDYYIAVKSLFHSFRIVNFGLQIATEGAIVNYHVANDIWEEIKTYYTARHLDWNFYNEKFKSRHNELMTEFRKHAEKV